MEVCNYSQSGRHLLLGRILVWAVEKLLKLRVPPTLIGLGKVFYSIKLLTVEGAQRLMDDGPWFFNGFFLSVRRWESEFRPSTAIVQKVPKWFDLQELPIEFHILDVLKSISNAIGKSAKADFKGAELNRASYACICCQVDDQKTPPSSVWIGGCKQTLIDVAFYTTCSICNLQTTPSHTCQPPTKNQIHHNQPN